MQINIEANVKKILLNEWDPIGVQSIPEAENEYDIYIPRICYILMAGRPAGELYECLRWIEEDRMGLNFDHVLASEIVLKLMALDCGVVKGKTLTQAVQRHP